MKTLSALLLTGEPTLLKNRNLNEQSAIRLENLARSLLLWEKHHLHFTTGIGISEKGFPLRLPAIVVPTLRVMERLQALWIYDVEYTLYQAKNFLIQNQWMDAWMTSDISHRMEQYIREYINRKFPEISDRVDLDFEREIDPSEIQEVQSHLPSLDLPSMQQIIAYAKSKWRSSESAYEYAAANILANRYAGSAHHILIGWEKERPFFWLSEDYETRVLWEKKTIPLIHSVGRIPPYYPQVGEEDYFDAQWNLVAWIESPKNNSLAYDYSIL